MAKTNAPTEWLGIPPDEQQPNHYQLLGLELFTSDRGRIDAAAENAIDRVRRSAGESDKAVADKLIRMIEAARGCLLNGERKTTYDLKVGAAKKRAPATQESLPEPIELDQIVQSDEPSAGGRSRNSSSSMLMPIVGGAIAPLLIYVFMFSGWFGGEKTDNGTPGGEGQASIGEELNPRIRSSTSQPTTTKSTLNAIKTSAEKTIPIAKTVGKTPSTSHSKNTVKVTTGKNAPATVKNTDPVKKTTPAKKTVPVKNTVPVKKTTPAKNAVATDLLKLINPKKHSLQGEWKLNKGSLECAGVWPRIEVPFAPSEEYELRMTATLLPKSSIDPTLLIGLVGGGRQFVVVLNQQMNGIAHKNGLFKLDDKKLPQNETYALVETTKVGVPVQIVCRVLKTGVTVTVDGRRIINWKGKFSRLQPYKKWTVPNPKHLMLGSASKYRITKFVYRPIESTRSVTPSVVPSQRAGIPDIAARKNADKLIREIFKDEFAKLKRTSDKLKLARKLLEQGRTTNDDPAARYVLLQKAKELALEVCDTELALNVVDSIVQHYDVDRLATRLSALTKLASSAKNILKGKAVAKAAFDNADHALKVNNFQMAIEFAKLARSTAVKFRQRRSVKQIAEFRTKVLALQQWDRDARDADVALKRNPDDAAANLVKGQFLCFIKLDWSAGLRLLTKCDEAELQAVAKLDVAGPTDGKGMAAIADAWRKLAASNGKVSFRKSQWLIRAVFWYQRAAGNLTGLQKTLVEKRIKDIAKIPDVPVSRGAKKSSRKTVTTDQTGK